MVPPFPVRDREEEKLGGTLLLRGAIWSVQRSNHVFPVESVARFCTKENREIHFISSE